MKPWVIVLWTLGFPCALFACTLGILSDPQLVSDLIRCDYKLLSEEMQHAADISSNATILGLQSRGAVAISAALNTWVGVRSRLLMDLAVVVVALLLADKPIPPKALHQVLTRSSWILVCGEIVETLMRVATRRLYGIPAVAYFLRPLDIHNPWHLLAISANVFAVGYIGTLARSLAMFGGVRWALMFAAAGMCYYILVLMSVQGFGDFVLLP